MKIEHYMAIALALIIIFTFPIFPIPQQVNADDVIIIKTSGTPSCAGANSFVLAQNLTDLCDVTIISPSTNQILKYNGTQWINSAVTFENTVCNNAVGGGEGLCINNLITLKRLLAGSNLSLSSNSTHITITNTAPESTVCSSTASSGTLICESSGNVKLKRLLQGTGITISNNSTHITITNSLPESTTASNLGSIGEGIFAQLSGFDLQFKKLVAGTGISLSSNSTRITITNTQPEQGCSSAGGITLLKTPSTCDFKGLTAGAGITVTSNTNDNNIKTNFANGTGIQITGSGTQTFTNTGVISNSCTAPIVCSGTNPSAISYADNPYWQMLCNTSGTGDISCSSFTAKKFLHVEISYVISASGTATSPDVQFNSDTGANYAWRASINGAAETTASATNQCRLQGSTVGNNGGGRTTMDIINISTQRKVTTYQTVVGIDTSAGTLPARTEAVCKWDNTASQINTIKLMRDVGTATFVSGTQITVWGHD